MTETAHDHARPGTLSTPLTRDGDLAPGRASRSAAMDAPAHPVVSGLIARKAERDDNGVAAGADQAVATASSSSGMALPSPIMRKFESSLGADLSSVRVHTGAESANAASAVGAKAYTMGQDIHFGAGHYDPSSGAGEHLLAHEVAHTVQQGGGTPTRQNKLEVSGPGDGAELEADHAANAMVSGGTASVTFGAGVQRKIFREAAPAAAPAANDDKGWATDARVKVEQFQNAVTTAMGLLNTDATAAAASLYAAEASCEQFETAFKAAKQNFTKNVKAALKEEAEFEEMLAQGLETALAMCGLLELETAEKGIVGAIEKTKGLLTVVSSVQKVAGVAPEAKSEGPTPIPGAKIDWKGQLDQALTTLTSYIAQNKDLTALITACTNSDHWLTQVVEGHGPSHPRQATEGVAADKLANGVQAAQAQLGAVAKSLSTPAAAFAAGIQANLTARGLGDQRKIEQDIALRWMSDQPINENGTTSSGKGGRGSSEIHAAREYLETLGVIGKDSRTGVDAGMWDTDVDDDNIVGRAKAEAAAIRLVGSVAEWQGGTVNGNVATGHIVAGEETWIASGPAAQNDQAGANKPGLTAAAGGNVRIAWYTIAPITKEVSDAPPSMKAALFHALVTLQVVADGAMGGGAAGVQPAITQGAPAAGGGE